MAEEVKRRMWAAGLPVIITVLTLLALTFVQTQAYETYHDPTQDGAGYCASCHTTFPGRGLLHDMHVGNRQFVDKCYMCHTGNTRNNPLIMWSQGNGTAGSNYGCAGCHGRSYGETIKADYDNGTATFPTQGLPKVSGYGLRKQHILKGVTQCMDCHKDMLRCEVQSEAIPPPNYGKPEVFLTSSCSGDNLDNDGDGRIDMADPNCDSAMGTTPGEAGNPCGSNPLLVTGYNPATGDISISFDIPCSATDHSIYWGPMAYNDIKNHNYTGQVCSVGTGGTATFNPGTGSAFFVVVPNEGTYQGSFGEQMVYADPNIPARSHYAERPEDQANACGLLQDLTERCD